MKVGKEMEYNIIEGKGRGGREEEGKEEGKGGGREGRVEGKGGRKGRERGKEGGGMARAELTKEEEGGRDI